MKENKAYLFVIPTVILALVLVTFVIKNNQSNSDSSDTTDSQTNQTATVTGESTSGATSITADSNVVTDQTTQTLAVNPNRCRGCGKCAMIDPEHFELSGHTAQVISQDNLDSSSLSSAIRSCPESAISLT